MVADIFFFFLTMALCLNILLTILKKNLGQELILCADLSIKLTGSLYK